MKQLLTALLILTSSVAMAQHRSPHGYATGAPHHHHHGNGWGWVAPALISGAVVYAITRPPVVVQQPQVITPPPDVVYIDGIAYRKQVVLINGYYQEVLVRI
jgi:hypothetical protein